MKVKHKNKVINHYIKYKSIYKYNIKQNYKVIIGFGN